MAFRSGSRTWLILLPTGLLMTPLPAAAQIAALRITGASVVEGSTGTTTATVSVGLSQTLSQAITVRVSTSSGGGFFPNATGAASCAEPDADFVTITNREVTIQANTFGTDVELEICTDTREEPLEVFFFTVDGGGGAPCEICVANVSIVDDEQSFSIGPQASVTEGHVGTTNANFTVSLSAPASVERQVTASTADGTARGGQTCADGIDYINTLAGLRFFPGAPLTQEIQIPVCGDRRDEPDQSFSVNLTGGLVIIAGQGQGTIVDDDGAPIIFVSSVSVPEGTCPKPRTVPCLLFHSVDVPVSLSDPSDFTVTATFRALVGGFGVPLASSGTDFTPVTSTVTFAPGDTSEVARVRLIKDGVAEPDELFLLRLSGPTNARCLSDFEIEFGRPRKCLGSVKIVNDD